MALYLQGYPNGNQIIRWSDVGRPMPQRHKSVVVRVLADVRYRLGRLSSMLRKVVETSQR